MVTINLLPWREQQTRYEKRVLMYVILGAAACALFILLCCDRYLSYQKDASVERVEHLKKELSWRQGLANYLQQPAKLLPQNNVFDFFQRLNESDSREVCFEQIKKNKSGIELRGLASSSEQLTAFLQSSPLAAYFAELKINQLQQVNGQLKFNILGKAHAV